MLKVIPRSNVSPQDQLRAMIERGALDTTRFNVPEMPTQPTEEVAREEVDARGIPMVPSAERDITQLPTITDQQSLAQAGRMPFQQATPYGQPKYNADGSVMRDQDGNPIMEDVPLSAFQQAQQEALGRTTGIRQTMEETQADVMDPVAVTKGILKSASDRSDTLDARQRRGPYGETTEARIDTWANRAAPMLDRIHNKTATELFSMQDASARDVETNVPIGIKVAVEEGWVDPQSPTFNDDLKALQPLATITGLSFFTAVNQATTADPSDGQAKRMAVAANGATIEDAMYMGDITDATEHSVRNAMDRLGIKAKPETIHALAQAKVMSAISDGDLMVNLDGNGRWILTASPEVKAMGRRMKYLTEALTGDPKRMLPGKTPQIGGSTFDKPGPSVSKNSRKTAGIVTAAADMVKNIFGSMGYKYNPKDVAYKKKEYQDIFSEENVEKDPATGLFMYSRSIFAGRNKLSKKDFDKQVKSVDPVKTGEYNANKHAARARAEALKVMNEKKKTLEFDLMNGEGLMGSVRFMAWTHALSNQRFFPKSSGMNYMESKTGARDMLNVALQDAARGNDLFDPTRVQELKARGRAVFLKKGWPRHDAFKALTGAEQGALGAMLAAVVNYYTGAGPALNKDVLKLSEAQQLEMYTPEIGKYLADLGRQYNNWLEDAADPKDGDTIVNHLAAMEPGESLGNKNLWDDFFRLQNAYVDPQTKNATIEMSHLSFDDGNQNGIFLQSLLFGNGENTLRLGAFIPSLGDMRDFAVDSFLEKLDELTKDDSDATQGWRSFMKALMARDGAAKVASDLFKAPLMQNAYGKDASMFKEFVIDWLEADNNAGLVSEHLGMYAGSGNAMAASEVAGVAVEATLRDIIDSANTAMLKNIGRHSSLTNTVLTMEGATGDTLFFTPVGTVPQYKGDHDAEVWKAPDGTLRKIRSNKTSDMRDSEGNIVSMHEELKQLDPAATKGRQYFWNTKTKKYDHFDNPLGSAQSRLVPVMLVQSLDGDLVKLATLLANRGRQVPVPAMWVHDSIISSGSGALAYRNVYNNIAIPSAIPYMASVADRLTNAWQEGQTKAFEDIKNMEAVGIGADGEYPALGAYFDEQWERVQDDGSYKQIFMSRKHNNELKWQKEQARINGYLDEARKAGWRAPGDIGRSEGPAGIVTENQRRAQLAVTPKGFKDLVGIASSMMKLAGPEGKLKTWKGNFGSKVEKNFKDFTNNASVKAFGIAQMTPTGANPPKAKDKATPVSPEGPRMEGADFFDVPPMPVYAPGVIPKAKKEFPNVPF